METLTIDVDADGVALVTFDVPGRSMNTITAAAMRDFTTLIERLKTDDAIKGAVIASGKASGFCAGADLGEMGDRTTTGAPERRGQVGRPGPQRRRALPDASPAGDLRQAGRGRHRRPGAGRRAGDRARLPLPRRGRQSEDPARPARGQGGPAARRRRHAAPAAPDRRHGRRADAAGGQADAPAGGARRRLRRRSGRRRARRSRRAKTWVKTKGDPVAPLGQERSSRSPAAAPTTRPARRSSSWATPCCASRATATTPPSMNIMKARLRGPAGADRRGAAHREPLLRQDAA